MTIDTGVISPSSVNESVQEREPLKKGVYMHYKGKRYEVVDIARHSETEEEMVVYRTLYGKYDLWVRPLAMFLEPVTLDGEQVPRFRFVRSAD